MQYDEGRYQLDDYVGMVYVGGVKLRDKLTLVIFLATSVTLQRTFHGRGNGHRKDIFR